MNDFKDSLLADKGEEKNAPVPPSAPVDNNAPKTADPKPQA
jgi:hypothetical protein